MHQCSLVPTMDLDPPCLVAEHQRANLLPTRVLWIAVFLGEPNAGSIERWEGWWWDMLRRWRRHGEWSPAMEPPTAAAHASSWSAAHRTGWGWSLGFGDWKFWGDLVVSGSILGRLLCDLARERSISGARGTIWREGKVDLVREGAGTRGEAHGIGCGGFYACLGVG